MLEDVFGISINFDWSWISLLGEKSYIELWWFFFLKGGWIVLTIVILWGLFAIYVYRNEKKFSRQQTYIYLALDVPKTNLQSPKAVENIFSVLAGAHMPLEWEEKIFEGKFQLGFSLEIVSIDGYIQYVIRTPIHWRDLVEAAIYSQYPDAEITEVEDYTKEFDITFPNDEYNLWGSDLVLSQPYWFPIRTYLSFEHSISKDIKDPLITLLEVMNKLGPGENLYFQILLYPLGFEWMKPGEKELRKIIGMPIKETKKFIDKAIEAPITLLSAFSEQLFGTGVPAKEEKTNTTAYIPPIEKIKAEGIAQKISKIGFETKLRICYLAKNEVFNKGLGVSGAIGAIKQFTDLNLNGLKPDVNKTVARWPWFKKKRVAELQRNFWNFYRKRDAGSATPKSKCILNIEELASLYHFPYFEVFSPKVKKIESKKAKAPTDLPSMGIGLPVDDEPNPNSEQAKRSPVIEYDDDYFEKRFAKDKTGKADKLRKEKIMSEIQDKVIEVDQSSVVLPGPINEEEEQIVVNKEETPKVENKKNNLPPANLPFGE